jgi:hypothetical protein
MYGDTATVAVFVPIIGSIGLFSFLAVASWSNARRREREAYYTNDALRRVVEVGGGSAEAGIQFLRQREYDATRERRETQKLTGLVTIATGVGLMIFLRAVERHEPDYVVGIIPVLVGLSFLIYAYLLAPKR